MKHKKILLILISITLVGFTSLWGQSFVIQKDVYVAEDEVQKNVIALGGDVLIKGKVKESVVAIGGSITIEGEVGEVVLGIGSPITLKSTAIIKGDVVALGGSLLKEPGTTIKGDTIYFKVESLKDVLGILSGLSFAPFIPILIIIKLIAVFIWFILALVLAAIFPRQLALASAQIRKSFWSTFGIGLLAIIIFTGLTIFSAFLSLILIGIPFLLALILIGVIIKIFGRVTVFYFFGDSLARAFGSKNPSSLVAVILGLILVEFVGFIPILGSLFLLVMSIIGWGSVLRSKFGTTNNWFKKG